MSLITRSRRFEGKTAVVTAAASGIGWATTVRLLDEGATVYASDKNLDALRKSALSRSGDDRLVLGELDVSVYENVQQYIAAVRKTSDALDVVVNNAGLGSWGAVDRLDVERWHTVIAVTLDSVFYMSKETVPLLRHRGGAIVNTSSISGLVGDNGFAAYNAAKAGVINLTRTLAVDHAVDGIRANAVCPGLTDTPRVSWMKQNEDIAASYDTRIPMKRPGTAEEMAAAIAFLASDDAAYITGVALPVDGGMTASVQPPFLELLPDRI